MKILIGELPKRNVLVKPESVLLSRVIQREKKEYIFIENIQNKWNESLIHVQKIFVKKTAVYAENT